MRFSLSFLLLSLTSPMVIAEPLPLADGFRGIWYMNQPTKDEYHFKYSGGMATYPQQHAPIAIYRKEVDRTFFVFGGVANYPPAKAELLHMIAYYDHKTGMVSRPRILLNKKTDDAHDNPTLQIDDAGYLWIFSSSHGTARPSFIHRSTKPYEIDSFEKMWETNFSYTQPWHVPGKGFLFLHTRYKEGRGLFTLRSEDGEKWNPPSPLAKIEMGDYQISWRHGNTIATAFDYHPSPTGLNARTNIYFLTTEDLGTTWKNASGEAVKLPLSDPKNAALVRNFHSEKKLVYLKDVNFTADSKPVILFLTSSGHEPGPKGGTREWFTARWTGAAWDFQPFTTSDHNYDHGSLHVEFPARTESGELWRVIAPTDPGPQVGGTGGEMVMWTSGNRGHSWDRVKTLTANSPRNHTYARRPFDAHPDFYALWADGNAFKASESHLYFCNREGHVYRLPSTMTQEAVKPDLITR